MFDAVVLATDEKFKNFVPIVSYAWRAYFPTLPKGAIKVAFVTNRTTDDPVVLKMGEYCQPILFPEVEGIPTANLAKMARFIVASKLEDTVAMIEDIDTIPLQAQYYVNRCMNILSMNDLDNTFLAVGREVYEGTPHEGKFPISTMTATGNTFSKLINPENLDIPSLIESWKNISVFDEKEDITKENFSDESLWRVLIDRNQDPDCRQRVNIKYINRDINIHTQWLDRSWWGANLNTENLHNDYYVTCNFKRPMEDHFSDCEQIFNCVLDRYNDRHGDSITPERSTLLLEDTNDNISEKIGKYHWVENVYGLNLLMGPSTHPGDGSILSHEGECVVFASFISDLKKKNIISDTPVMLELGSNFALYSLLFRQMCPSAKNILVELISNQLKVGEKNFELNGHDYSSYLGGIGLKTSQTANDGTNIVSMDELKNFPEYREYIGAIATDTQIGPELSIEALWKNENISTLDVLHADIQGSEVELMNVLSSSGKLETIKAIFIATHSNSIHEQIKKSLSANNFNIIFECPHKGKFHYRVGEENKIGGFGDDGFLIAYNKKFHQIKE